MGQATFDTGVPHPARVYDYWLGGKDNFAADRQVAEEVLRVMPVMAHVPTLNGLRPARWQESGAPAPGRAAEPR